MTGKLLSRRSVLAATAAFALGGTTAKAAGFTRIPKAMWVWKDRIATPGSLPSFVETWRIDTLFLYTTPAAASALISGDPRAVGALHELAAAGARGVYLCAGEPDWCRPLSKLPEHAALVIRAHQSLKHLTAGIHFDVEPNALPDWHDMRARAALGAGLLRFYELVGQNCARANITAAANPAFAAQSVGEANLLDGLARRVGALSLMAYRDRVGATLELVRPAISAVRSAGTSWWVGVDVEPESSEPHITWAGRSPTEFTAAMQSVHDQARRPGYLGLCFQSYDGLRMLLSN